MVNLSEKSQEKIIEELKWRFSLSEIEIQDTINKTIQYLNTIAELLKIEDPKQLQAIVEKLIKIS